jgi:hypothetical protein
MMTILQEAAARRLTLSGGERFDGHEDARQSPPGRGLSPVSPRPISLAHRHRKDIGP